MTVMNSELHRALIEAGVSDETARKAAESVAAYDRQFAEVKSDLRLLKWMAASNIGLSLVVLGKLLMP